MGEVRSLADDLNRERFLLGRQPPLGQGKKLFLASLASVLADQGTHTAGADLKPPRCVLEEEMVNELVRAKQQRKQLHEGWTQWLEGLPWDHYATLTFKRSSGPDFAQRVFAGWIRRLELEAGMPLLWFVGFENGHLLGRLHIHSLVGNTRDVSIAFLAKEWRHGFSRIERYDPNRGAAHYVSKYVTKDLLDFDISPHFDRALAARDRQLTFSGLNPAPTIRGPHA